MTQKERRDKYRDEHKRAGLCVDCNREAEPGRIRCRHHLDLQAKKAKNRRIAKTLNINYIGSEEHRKHNAHFSGIVMVEDHPGLFC